MKKVGLVTLYNSNNYGALLQAYALQQSIKKNNCDCYIIKHDRFGAILEQKTKKRDAKKYGHLIKMIIKNPRLVRVYFHNLFLKEKNTDKNNCDVFRENFLFPKSEKFYHSVDEIVSYPPKYDVYVCGSDQIWNPERVKCSEPFYLDFGDDNIIRIAYAPSIAVKSIPNDLWDYYKKKIKKIDVLSIREKSGCQAIEIATGYQAECVLDPIFLLEKEEWKEISVFNKYVSKRYIFCYFLSLQNLSNMRKKINEAAKRFDAQVVVLLKKYTGIDKTWKSVDNVGPREFLGLIIDAVWIFTDSFHGTAFAIKMEKNFYTYKSKNVENLANRFGRIENILEITGLETNAIDEITTINFTMIDYQKVNNKLIVQIEKSNIFLREALAYVKI